MTSGAKSIHSYKIKKQEDDEEEEEFTIEKENNVLIRIKERLELVEKDLDESQSKIFILSQSNITLNQKLQKSKTELDQCLQKEKISTGIRLFLKLKRKFFERS